MDILIKDNVTSPIGPLVATFLLGFTTIILLFWYSARKHSYWKTLGVPYVEPYPIIGTVWQNTRKPIQLVEDERYKKFGRIYGHYEGNKAVLSVAEPEILRNIMVKDFPMFTGRRRLDNGDPIIAKMLSVLPGGDDWKRIRTIVSPTFTTGKLKRMMGIFNECSQTLVNNFRQIAEKDEVVEARTFYGAFTMDVIASSAFSTKIDSHNDPNNPFVKTARGIFTQKLNWRLVFFILFPGIMKFFGITIVSPHSLNFFKDATLSIIEERKRTGQTRNDFLQLLMDTAREVSDEGKLDVSEKENDIAENYGKEENDHIFKGFQKKSLSSDELVAQCIIFFLAGYETTATTLALASYLLALHPDIQEELIHELNEALKKSDGELTYEVIQSLKHLDNTISETLRLYPPPARIERLADENYKLQGTDIVVPKGMIITIPIYSMHRDPKNFPDPEKFDPNRFNPEERAKRHQYAYMPFGAGPRNCVAMRFALMEIKVCLAHILMNFRIKRCPETKVPMEWNISQGLQPKDVSMKFEIRKDTVTAF